MGDNQFSRGYGSTSRSGSENDFGSDFISFGSDNTQEASNNQWRQNRRRFPQSHRISGAQRGQKYFMERETPNQHHLTNAFRGSDQRRFHQTRGGKFRDGRSGYRGSQHHHGLKQQGARLEAASEDILSYYHPSMMEDPWKELEMFLKIPPNEGVSSSSKSEPLEHVGTENIKDSESSHSGCNEDFD